MSHDRLIWEIRNWSPKTMQICQWTPSRKGTSSSLSLCLSASFAGTDESKLDEKKCIVNCRQLSVSIRDVRGGLLFRGAGRGKGKNPRGGAGRRWKSAGRGEKVRKSTNSKNLQKCEKYNITYYNINYKVKVKESFIFLLYFQKHVLLSLWRLHNVHIIIQYICTL